MQKKNDEKIIETLKHGKKLHKRQTNTEKYCLLRPEA